jgi:hypothetical protein
MQAAGWWAGRAKALMREIRRFLVDIADENRQVRMTKPLADRHVFAHVIPVMVDDALHQ